MCVVTSHFVRVAAMDAVLDIFLDRGIPNLNNDSSHPGLVRESGTPSTDSSVNIITEPA